MFRLDHRVERHHSPTFGDVTLGCRVAPMGQRACDTEGGGTVLGFADRTEDLTASPPSGEPGVCP